MFAFEVALVPHEVEERGVPAGEGGSGDFGKVALNRHDSFLRPEELRRFAVSKDHEKKDNCPSPPLKNTSPEGFALLCDGHNGPVPTTQHTDAYRVGYR